jgi:hypothetical protein
VQSFDALTSKHLGHRPQASDSIFAALDRSRSPSLHNAVCGVPPPPLAAASRPDVSLLTPPLIAQRRRASLPAVGLLEECARPPDRLQTGLLDGGTAGHFIRPSSWMDPPHLNFVNVDVACLPLPPSPTLAWHHSGREPSQQGSRIFGRQQRQLKQHAQRRTASHLSR